MFKASRGIEDIYELTYIRKDGSRFPAVVSVTALRDAQDAIIGYLLIGTDNTARKQAEEALLKAGALQSAIFNSANFSSIATDAKGVIQIFNVGAERMLGYTAAEVMNKITPADISDPQEVIARAEALSVELGTPITPGFEALVFKASRGIEDIYELTYIRKDGSRFPAVVSVTALRDAQDAIIGYLLIGTDNTARKQAEEALLKAGALQRAIFNSANFLEHRHRREGRHPDFQRRRRADAGLHGRRSDEQDHAGRHFRSAGSDRARRSIEPRTRNRRSRRALRRWCSRPRAAIEDIYELTYIRKDGSRFPAVVSVTALRDAQGAIIGYLLIGTDNTARKQVEAEQKKLDQAREAAEAEVSRKNNELAALSRKLAKYLSPQVYNSIFTGAQSVEIASNRKKLTVFFSDIADFSGTTEKLESEELTQLLNRYLTEMARIGLEFGATIDKYIGDAVLAFFGDPELKGTKQDARACVRMAIAMQRRMRELQWEWQDLGAEKPFQMRIGLIPAFAPSAISVAKIAWTTPSSATS